MLKDDKMIKIVFLFVTDFILCPIMLNMSYYVTKLSTIYLDNL